MWWWKMNGNYGRIDVFLRTRFCRGSRISTSSRWSDGKFWQTIYTKKVLNKNLSYDLECCTNQENYRKPMSPPNFGQRPSADSWSSIPIIIWQKFNRGAVATFLLEWCSNQENYRKPMSPPKFGYQPSAESRTSIPIKIWHKFNRGAVATKQC